MNIKKFAAALLSGAMACVFATAAFADSSKAAAIEAKMAAYGLSGFNAVIESLTDEQQQYLIDNSDTLIAQADQVIAYNNDNHSAEDTAANVQNALNNVKGILETAGISASVDVAVSGNTVTVTPVASSATATGAAAPIVKTVDPSKETNAPAKETTATSDAVNNAVKNSAVATTASSNANPISASSSAVIKATGDNSAVVFAAAALAVAGVLGMAVRKERAL